MDAYLTVMFGIVINGRTASAVGGFLLSKPIGQFAFCQRHEVASVASNLSEARRGARFNSSFPARVRVSE